MNTYDQSFTSAGHTLAGTMVEPADPAGPIALLVSGSGPIDRDSNMKRLRLDVMSQVAAGLSESGIGSFRYDKRGIGASEGNYHATGLHDNVADAAAALALIRDRWTDSEVYVIGHSEGALIAAELAATEDSPDGIVLLAGAAQPGKAILRWQAQQLAGSIPAIARGIMKLLRKDIASMQEKRFAQLEATTDDVARIQLVRVNARWFREFMSHDPAAGLPSVGCDVLALTGDKDIQVDPADIERIGELVAGRFVGEVVPDLTHILRKTAREPNIRDYKKLVKLPVDGSLLQKIAGWITDPSMRGEERHDSV